MSMHMVTCPRAYFRAMPTCKTEKTFPQKQTRYRKNTGCCVLYAGKNFCIPFYLCLRSVFKGRREYIFFILFFCIFLGPCTLTPLVMNIFDSMHFLQYNFRQYAFFLQEYKHTPTFCTKDLE
jgi:hypothetical protein